LTPASRPPYIGAAQHRIGGDRSGPTPSVHRAPSARRSA
jgi:hypothetical protein